LKSLIPPEYHSFLPLFCESIANKLPPHRPYDHRIPLKEGFEPPFGLLYSLARHELEACKKWIEENLYKGFIRASSSVGNVGNASHRLTYGVARYGAEQGADWESGVNSPIRASVETAILCTLSLLSLFLLFLYARR